MGPKNGAIELEQKGNVEATLEDRAFGLVDRFPGQIKFAAKPELRGEQYGVAYL